MRFLLLVAAYFAATATAISSHSSPAATLHRRSVGESVVVKRQGLIPDLLNGLPNVPVVGPIVSPIVGGGDGGGTGGDGGNSSSSSSSVAPTPTDSSSSSSSSPTDSSSESSSSSSSTTESSTTPTTSSTPPPLIPNPISIISSIVDTLLPGPSTTALPATSDTDTASSAAPTSTPDDPQPTSTPPPTTTPDDPASSAPSSTPDPTPTTSSPPPILSSIISIVTSVVHPPDPTSSDPASESVSNPPTSEPTQPPTSVPPTDLPTSFPPTSVGPTEPPTSVEPTVPPTSVPPTTVVPPPDTTSSEPPISFPSGNATTTVPPPTTTDAPTSVEPTETATSIPINPDFSFVLTASSLAVASLPTSSVNPSTTLSDPDQVIATTDSAGSTIVAVPTDITPPALPSGIPARILPGNPLDPNTDLTGYSLVSIAFTNELNWLFVTDNELSSGQIFAYLPTLIQAALPSLTADQIKTFCLQVLIPTTYRTPSDAIELGTMWLGYIPSNVVDDLAAQIKAKQSKFYTGNANPVARDLASRVNSGFNIRSVAGVSGNSGNPNGVMAPNGLNNGGSGDVTNASQSAKERQDAIIGVVSALGGIALLVLVFLVYRSLKRRRQLKHRRLSDPPQGVEDPFADDAGIRPEGREFDEDSMGAPRRRSFYFAEDSLRAAGVNTGAVSPVSSGHGYSQSGHGHGGQMGMAVSGSGYAQVSQVANSQVSLSQRRPVVTPGAISAPILRESSMNW